MNTNLTTMPLHELVAIRNTQQQYNENTLGFGYYIYWCMLRFKPQDFIERNTGTSAANDEWMRVFCLKPEEWDVWPQWGLTTGGTDGLVGGYSLLWCCGLFSPGHFHKLYLLHINNGMSMFEAVFCTSELWHHVQVLHINTSARPWAVGKEVKCIAYLRMTWKQQSKMWNQWNSNW